MRCTYQERDDHGRRDQTAQAPQTRPGEDRLREAILRGNLRAGGHRPGTGAAHAGGAHRATAQGAPGCAPRRRPRVAVLVTGRILLDTNVLINYLRVGRHGAWVWGGRESRIRFLSAVVLLELRLGA